MFPPCRGGGGGCGPSRFLGLCVCACLSISLYPLAVICVSVHLCVSGWITAPRVCHCTVIAQYSCCLVTVMLMFRACNYTVSIPLLYGRSTATVVRMLCNPAGVVL